MKKILILLVCFFRLISLISQNYKDPIDSTITNIQLSDKDWGIGLKIDQAGLMPIFDSLGKLIDNDPTGLYVLSQINKQCFLRKFETHYSEYIPVYQLKQKKQISITDTIICNYTIDSIQKAKKEWIYPNIYLDNSDSLKVYDVQQNGNHSPFYRIYFRTKHSIAYLSFGEIDVFNPPWGVSIFHENLNYKYNSSTFIYRAFINIIALLKRQFNIRVLQ